MRTSLIPLLACPSCRGSLAVRDETVAAGQVESGTLRCLSCGKDHPVRQGIPRLSGEAAARRRGTVVGGFGWHWREFREHQAGYEAAFRERLEPLGPADLAGRVVLDAGCGMGRFSAAAAGLGARTTVGFDISDAVEVLQGLCREREDVHVVQGDILNPPFAPAFDLVFSVGVLHHLEDGEAGLQALLGCLRPAGTVHVLLNGREGNEWRLRWVDPVRRLLASRLPLPVLRLVALGLAVPLHALAVSRRAEALRFRLPFRADLDWLAAFSFRHTQEALHDSLAAPVAHFYRREEVEGWFGRAGLLDVRVAPREVQGWRGTARLPAGG